MMQEADIENSLKKIEESSVYKGAYLKPSMIPE